MIFLDYIYNKVYAPVEEDFGFDDAGDIDELDDELQMEEGGAVPAAKEVMISMSTGRCRWTPIRIMSASTSIWLTKWLTRVATAFSRLPMLVLSM